MSKRPDADNVVTFSLDRFKSKRKPEKAAPTKPKKPPKRTEPFVQLPYERLMKAYGKLTAAALYVAIELERQHFKSFTGNPVTLTNQN